MTVELFTADRATAAVTSGGTDAPVGGTTETWTVASSAMFGAAAAGVSQFHVADPLAPAEMIAVTNVSGTTWTVTRGADSTTPVAHVSGFSVYQVMTAGFLRSVMTNAGSGSSVLPLVSVPPPSGDATGVTDTAAIQALENAATAAGAILVFAPGTYWVTGLTKQAVTIWQGAGRYSTTVKLAAGADADVIQGASFSSLTLSGSLAGIGGWGIRDLTIDGNKTAQSGTSYGLRIYGYNFDLTSLSIQNCLTDGLYTEWGNFGQPGPDRSMEARYYGLKIEGCGGYGWHNRGPHDSRIYDVTIFANGAGLANYWAESCQAAAVAVASNGVNVATFAGSGVLAVGTALGFPAASISATQGSLTVATSAGTAVITYTGTTAGTFTGCTTVSGSGTLSTGNAVTATGRYSANGCLLFGVHCYGSTAGWQYILDADNDLEGCVGEVAVTGMVLVRSASQIVGGNYFVIGPQTGCGIQIGDSSNGVSQCYIRTQVNGLACASSATAALNIVFDLATNDIEVAVYAASGSVAVSTAQLNNKESRYQVWVTGQSQAANLAASFFQPSVNYGGMFGAGGDGAVTLDGVAVPGWATLAGSTYSMTRDCQCTSLTVNNGITLVTKGCRIFVQGNLTNSGNVNANGLAASGATRGGATGSNSLAGSPAGVSGGTGNGSNGSVISTAANLGPGGGGNGGAGQTGTAGTGAANSGGTGVISTPQAVATGTVALFGSVFALGGGCPGGAGGGDGANSGGGSGSGGGTVGILAWFVINNGTITAIGGAGGTPPSGNCGGGGGGGGGLIVICALAFTSGSGSFSVAPGGAGSASGTGAAGHAGSAGSVLTLLVE